MSLVEAMTTLALASLVMALAEPAAQAWIQDTRQAVLANDLLSDLALARLHAIGQGQRVALCVSEDGQTCATSVDWHSGRIVFVDSNNNAARDPDESLLAVRPAGPVGWSMTGNSPVAHYVSYHPSGSARLVNGGIQMGTLTICAHSSAAVTATQVVINAAGRARSERKSLPECR